MTVIDIKQYRAAQERPDLDHVSQDQWGRDIFRFAVEYPHLAKQSGENRTWTATIWAYSFQDAEDRLEAIRQHGVVAGQVMEVGDW